MTNSVIGALRVNLGLDSAQFQNGLRKSQASLDSFGKKMAVVGAGIAAAGTAAFAAFDSSAGRLGILSDQARLAGLSAQEFKIAALAVDQYGISQEKLSDILKDVNDKFGDYAATGGGELKDFFENIAPKVGLTIDSFKELSSSDALALYVDSLRKANLSQQEMTFYMEALANDATALVPAFRNNGKALDEMAAKAADMGLAMEDGLIASSREARAEMRQLGTIIQAQMDQSLVKLGPSLRDLAIAMAPVADGLATITKGILEWTDVAGKASRQFVDDFIAGMAGLPSAAIDSITRLGDGLEAGMTNIAQQAVEWSRGIIKAIADSLRGLYEAGVQAVKDLAAGMAAEFAALKDRAFGWGGDIVDGLKSGLSSARDRVRGAVSGLADTVKGVFTDEVEIQSPSKVFHRFGNWIAAGLANGISAGSSAAASAMGDMSGGVIGAGEAMKNGLKGVFSDVITGAKTVPQAVGDMLARIADKLVSSGIDLLFESLFAPLFGFGGGDLLTSALKGAGLSAVPGFANGGYHNGGLRIVGERGPELEATGAARYFNASQTKDMLSGGARDVNVTVSVDENGNLQAFVDQRAGRAAQQGISAYDRSLPSRVQQINTNPRRR